MSRFAAILISLLVIVLPALAQDKALRGVALVIGQSKYQHIPTLANPGNDARAIAGLLEDLGFEVTGANDRDARKLRRDLERFAEDAEGADAAVIYYSGHGIEAGGENWLVPVDADLASLDDVEKSLVPLSRVLDEIRAHVPLTIFLIDACRSNPFPPGTVAKAGGQSLPITGAGLGAPRGFATIESGATDDVGTIIGFAAEPGLPALDGEVGANSPYAAAILRHLSALTGTEFGLVMRMVTEEVYLKTGTKQRPWVNESLRKQLFFGAAVDLPTDESGAITGERRKLLLTIASLPGEQRKQVEDIASNGKVPLGTLYGILAALGETNMPKDAAALEQALQSQAVRLKSILDERNALTIDDPETRRLVAAADAAISEGAIKSARAFLDQAKRSVGESRAGIESVEAQVRAKRIANAAIMVKSAEAAEIDFDFATAVADYQAAYDWVRGIDQALAAKYKTYEADALQSIGSFQGDTEAMAKAISAYGVALSLIERNSDAVQWGKTTNNLANTYLRLGERELDNVLLDKAIALYRDVLALPQGVQVATTLSNLGIALQTLAQRSNNGDLYAEAENTFEEALKRRDRADDVHGYALDLLNAANLDVDLADRNGEPSRLKTAEEKITLALSLIDPVRNRIEWAQGKNNLAIAWRILGANQRDIAKVRAALKIYEEILPAFDRKSFPIDWGNTNGNIAIAHSNIGALEGSVASFETALGFYRRAFEEVTRARAPVFWAKLQNGYGMTLQVIGTIKQDAALIGEAATAFRNALEVRRKEINPEQWAESQQMLASALSGMASSTADVKLSDEAIAAYQAAREVFTREAFPSDWMSVSSGLAMALQGRGILTQDVKTFEAAEAIYKEVLSATDREKSPLDWASAMKDMATIQFMLGTTRRDKAEVEQAIASFDAALEIYSVHGGFMDRMMIGAMRGNAVKALELFK